MNVIQYFSKPALVGYLQSHNESNRRSRTRKHNDELSKKKSVARGESPITPAQALKTKLEEESITETILRQ